MLNQSGFLPWINSLVLLWSSSSSAVWLNGNIGSGIKHLRGLWYGDPISLYLFILAFDILHRLFLTATGEGLLSLLSDRAASFRMSLYADDVVLFINSMAQDVRMVMRLMQLFDEATSLRVNTSKSTVSAIRCEDVDLDSVLQCFNKQRTGLPIKYLGLPVTTWRLKINHLQHVIDRVQSRLAGWQSRLLTIAGQRELVHIVLSSLPVYSMTALKLPKTVLNVIDKALRRFLWVGSKQLHGGVLQGKLERRMSTTGPRWVRYH